MTLPQAIYCGVLSSTIISHRSESKFYCANHRPVQFLPSFNKVLSSSGDKVCLHNLSKKSMARTLFYSWAPTLAWRCNQNCQLNNWRKGLSDKLRSCDRCSYQTHTKRNSRTTAHSSDSPWLITLNDSTETRFNSCFINSTKVWSEITVFSFLRDERNARRIQAQKDVSRMVD